MYWALLMRHRHTNSRRKRLTTQGWTSWREGCPHQAGSLLKTPKWVELRWLATCVCQQEPESLFCMCPYHRAALHSENKRRWQERSRKKANSPLTCDPGGAQGAAPHAYVKRFKQSLWLHYLPSSSSPLHPSVDTRSHHAGADRPGITHSLAS